MLKIIQYSPQKLKGEDIYESNHHITAMASIIACGVKKIETWGLSTQYRGHGNSYR